MNKIVFCFALIFVFCFTVQSQSNPDPYNIGDVGPGGGVIFYEKDDWTDGWKYLEAAKLDWLGGLPGYSGNLTDPVKAFGKSSDPDYNDTSILVGSGDQNTFEISSFENDFNHDFYINVYGDIRGWYLPSKDEAVLLYEYIRDFGNNDLNLAENVYYTSSSDPGNTIIGWTVDMRDGYWGYSGKLGGLRKRAIRKVTFTDFSPNTNYSAYFSTKSSSINFGPSSNFSLNTNTTRSILFWLKPEGSGHVISKYRNFDSQNSDFLVTYRADTEDILFSGNGTTSHVFGSIPLNQWTHIAITIRSTESGNVFKGFVNGELKIEENINLSNNTVQEDFFVGSNPNLSGGDNGFIGFIDDLSFWDSVDGYYQTDKLRPFNSQEINSIATIPATGKESRLISLWNFDQENIQNNSINGQNIESGNETSNLVEYDIESPFNYPYGPTSLGFEVDNLIVEEIIIAPNTPDESVIASLIAVDDDTSLENLTFEIDGPVLNEYNVYDVFELVGRDLKIKAVPQNWQIDLSYPIELIVSDGKRQMRNGVSVIVDTSNQPPTELGIISDISTSWNLVEEITQTFSAPWNYTIPAINDSKQYKLEVSGTYGIANNTPHRDGYYSLSSQNLITGCDANWSFDGQCPAPEPTSPEGYSQTNIYEYIINNGKQGGYELSWSDGGYGDNSGSLTFSTYVEETSESLTTSISIDENVGDNYTVGKLSATDADSSVNSLVFSFNEDQTLVNDNDQFIINESNLVLLNNPDFETKSTYAIDVKVSDGAGEFTERLNVVVNDLEEESLPSISVSGNTSNFKEYESALVTISLSEALTEDLTVTLNNSGTAVLGEDFSISEGAQNKTVLAGGNGVGDATNQLSSPERIVPDSNGNIYIYEAGNNRISKWSINTGTSSTFLQGGMPVSPVSLTIGDDDNLYVLFDDSTIVRYDNTGAEIDHQFQITQNLGNRRAIDLDIIPGTDGNELAVLVADDTSAKIYHVINNGTSAELHRLDNIFQAKAILSLNNQNFLVSGRSAVIQVQLNQSEVESQLYSLEAARDMFKKSSNTIVLFNDNTPYENDDNYSREFGVVTEYNIATGAVEKLITVEDYLNSGVIAIPTFDDELEIEPYSQAIKVAAASGYVDQAGDIYVALSKRGDVFGTYFNYTYEDRVVKFGQQLRVNIPAGESSGLITLLGIEDNNIEGEETIVLTAETSNPLVQINDSLTLTLVDGPAANNLSASTNEDTPVEITLEGYDIEGNELTYSVNNPENGTVTLEGAVVTYTPNANFNGTDSFTYTANDGTTDSAEAIVTVTVSAVNDIPTVADVAASTAEDSVVEITLTGSDIDEDTLTFSVGEAANGTVTLEGAVVTYTPNANFNGTDSFTYTANDGTTDSAEAIVTVTVSAVADSPVFTMDSESSLSEGSEIGTVIIDLSATDGDGDELSYSLSNNSDDIFTIDEGALILNQTLDYESSTSHSVTIGVSDGELTDSLEFTLNVEDIENNSTEVEYTVEVYDIENEDNTEKLDYTQWTNSTESSGSGDFIFEISGGEDAALFTIDPVTGALDFIEAPDYENPSDTNGDNIYIVIVKITNINDGAPEVPVVTNQTSIAVPEAQTAAVDIDIIVTTNDADTDGDGIIDVEDNCPITYNPGQEDSDGDGVGDVCDDSDMDTFFDAYDECPNSTYGATVNAAGCETFSLPTDTFSVTVTSATCPDSSNGSITISSSNTDYSYRYAIDDQAPVALTDNTQTISNLSAGIYSVCVTVDGVADYNVCYTIEIKEPAPLVASSRVDVSSRNLQLDLSGSEEYQVTLNGKSFLTTNTNLSLSLIPGMNRVEVATALDCQGVYFEEIFVSEEVKVYPNPTPGPLQLFVAGSDREVEMSITSLSGNVIRKEILTVPGNRIVETTMGRLPEGLYLITLKGNTVKTTHKIIKE